MFIYVTDENSRDHLLTKGFNLLKHDKVNSIWVFTVDCNDFAELDVDCPCVVSNMLTF